MAEQPRLQPQLAAQNRPAQPVEQTAPVGEDVTYIPGPEDPSQVQWAGHHFHANIPKRVTNVDLIARARGNKFFKVGTFKPGDAVKVEETPDPKTPEQYRAHAVAWVKTMQSVDQLDRKWAAEETLRMTCGVGLDDIEYLMNLIEPIRSELRKRDMSYAQ